MDRAVSTEKKLLFEEVLKSLEGKNYIFFSRYNRLSVNDFGELRRKVEKVSEHSLVVKNTLMRRALEQLGLKDACCFLEGSVFVTLSSKDPQNVSRVLVDFAKGNENFQVSGACIDGGVYQASYLEQLAKMPSREVLIAMVVGGIAAPLRGFVSTLAQLNRSVVIALDQIQKKKAAQAS